MRALHTEIMQINRINLKKMPVLVQRFTSVLRQASNLQLQLSTQIY